MTNPDQIIDRFQARNAEALDKEKKDILGRLRLGNRVVFLACLGLLAVAALIGTSWPYFVGCAAAIAVFWAILRRPLRARLDGAKS